MQENEQVTYITFTYRGERNNVLSAIIQRSSLHLSTFTPLQCTSIQVLNINCYHNLIVPNNVYHDTLILQCILNV